ncbi:MAG: bacillithiol system redox-active protein YtxJ [Armatimonadota bacterium]
MLTSCNCEDDYQALLTQSGDAPLFLFKHSTRCGISASARRQVEQFLTAFPEVACVEVLVIEQRPLSQAIAVASGVTHTSPQLILFCNGKVVWHTSHFNITTEAMQKALATTAGE